MVSTRRPPEPRTAGDRPRPQRLIVGQLDLQDIAVVLSRPPPNLVCDHPTGAHDRRAAKHQLLLDDQLAPGHQRHHPCSRRSPRRRAGRAPTTVVSTESPSLIDGAMSRCQAPTEDAAPTAITSSRIPRSRPGLKPRARIIPATAAMSSGYDASQTRPVTRRLCRDDRRTRVLAAGRHRSASSWQPPRATVRDHVRAPPAASCPPQRRDDETQPQQVRPRSHSAVGGEGGRDGEQHTEC